MYNLKYQSMCYISLKSERKTLFIHVKFQSDAHKKLIMFRIQNVRWKSNHINLYKRENDKVNAQFNL